MHKEGVYRPVSVGKPDTDAGRQPVLVIMRDSRALSAVRAAISNPRGITGLETAIVLIAFVVVASVFAFAALSVGLFSAEESKSTIQNALADVQGTLGIKGSVFAKHNVVAGRNVTGDITETTGDFVEEIVFLVGNAAGGVAIDVTPGKTIIRYSDGGQSIIMDTASEFKSVGLGSANDDQVVQAGELWRSPLSI